MADPRFYDNQGPFTIGEIAEFSHIDYENKTLIADVNTLKEAGPDELSFFHNGKYLEDLKATKAGCVLTTSDFAGFVPDGTVALVVDTPYRAYATAAHEFYPAVDSEFSAREDFISPEAILSEGVVIEVGAVIKKGAEIGAGSYIGSHAIIGRGVKIGKNCRIGQNVTLSHCILGDHVTILPGTCIGQAGFGFFMDEKGHVNVPQLGRVVLEDRVEVGANVTIDRGALDDTFVGQGSRIDNLVQLGHGVQLGKHCVIVSQVGISGSTRLGDFVIAAGQAGLAGHLTIGDGAQIAAKAGLMRDVEAGEKVAGYPAVPVRQWHKQTVAIAKLIRPKKKKEA